MGGNVARIKEFMKINEMKHYTERELQIQLCANKIHFENIIFHQ